MQSGLFSGSARASQKNNRIRLQTIIPRVSRFMGGFRPLVRHNAIKSLKSLDHFFGSVRVGGGRWGTSRMARMGFISWLGGSPSAISILNIPTNKRLRDQTLVCHTRIERKPESIHTDREKGNYAVMPRDHKSQRLSYCFPRITSGAWRKRGRRRRGGGGGASEHRSKRRRPLSALVMAPDAPSKGECRYACRTWKQRPKAAPTHQSLQS